MTVISAALVRELREKTGAGMMNCKKALSENNGDMEVAIDWLRKKGLSAAAKKAGRVTAEGLVCVHTAGTNGVVIEVNSETDFVSRNEQFQDFVKNVAVAALEFPGEWGEDLSALNQSTYPGGARNIAEEMTQLVATIGENMNIRRALRLQVEQGVIASYVHNSLVPGLGKIAVLVALESGGDSKILMDLGRNLAMHIAAANPQFLTVDAVDQSVLDRERDILAEQARTTGKSEEIIAKMVEGRLRKYYEEEVLLEQIYVVDGENRVGKFVEMVAKSVGVPIKIVGFVRFALGEGIDRPANDFAAEVAAQAGV